MENIYEWQYKGAPVAGEADREETTMESYEFWTDNGDEDPIEAESLEQAAEIASSKISPREWADGAWGYVRGPEGQMAVAAFTPNKYGEYQAAAWEPERKD